MTTATSLAGTNAKCRNVRFCADIGVIAGVTQTSFEDRFGPILLQKSAMRRALRLRADFLS